MNLKNQLGKRIQDLRKAQKLTQEMLAEIMDVSQNYIASIECGNANMSLAKVLELSNFLKVDISNLLDFSE